MTEAEQDRILVLQDLIIAHPRYREARAHIYCAGPNLIDSTIQEVARWKIPESDKIRIQECYPPTDALEILVYWTADSIPEPLAGHGDMYGFMFHRETSVLILAEVGKWKS